MSNPAPGTVNPATGAPLEPVPHTPVDAIAGIVAASRAAQVDWSARSLNERIKAVRAIAQSVLAHEEEIVGLLAQEMGRSTMGTRLPEVSIIADGVERTIKTAKAALASEKISLSPLDFPGKRGVVEMVPRGVVGIIAPWNYPLMQINKPLFPALLAGNGVVIKPSEYTPRTGAFIARLCAEHLPAGLVGLVQGTGAQGAALLSAGIDAVTFTGSVRTGRLVAVACAERFIPCSVELGGKDAAIVLADANLDRTVPGLVYTSMFNAGQDCASVERIYVVDAIADEFVQRLAARVDALRVSPEAGAEVGPLQNARQLEIVEDHIAAALADGATCVAGGKATGRGYGYRPTVLDHCTAEMKVVREETFGPVVAIIRVPDADAALAQANDSDFGLNGSVWTTDVARGERLARRLQVGVCHVNGHSWTGGTLPDVPWGGVKQTGPGIVGSKHAYSSFACPRVVMVDTNSAPEPFWFPWDDDYNRFTQLLAERGRGKFTALFGLIPLLGRRQKTVSKRP